MKTQTQQQSQPSGDIAVLDTNVLLHFGKKCLLSFKKNDIAMHISVLRELATFKGARDKKGFHSRLISNFVDDLQEKYPNENFLPLGENRGALRILHVNGKPPIHKIVKKQGFSDIKQTDLIILSCALYIQEEEKMKQLKKESYKKVVFITGEVNLRVTARSLGIESKDYNNYNNDKKTEAEDEAGIHSGIHSIQLPQEIINAVYKNKDVLIPQELESKAPNSFIKAISFENPLNSSIFQIHQNLKEQRLLKPVNINAKKEILGIVSKNLEQKLCLELLLNPEIKLVTIVGKAGTGKTLLALAAGLNQILNDNVYERCILAKALTPADEQELGYLPGDKKEKLFPYMESYYDNLGLLKFNGNSKKNIAFATENTIESLESSGKLEVTALIYIRGRSLHNSFLIVDEVQNLTPKVVKTIITRAAKGAKIILIGDVDQIDNLNLSASDCGITFAAKFVHPKRRLAKIKSHITLTECERSELAELGAGMP